MKIYLAQTQRLTKSLLQNFAYAMTAMLSWHMKNFVAIKKSQILEHQKVISVRFVF